MTYHDYYLRGPDRDSTRAALLSAGLITAMPEADQPLWDMACGGVALDEVGEIVEGGEFGPEGEVITAPTALPGWHVNLRLGRALADAERVALAGILAESAPKTPYRVWA